MLDFAAWPGARPYDRRDLGGIAGITLHYTAGSAYATPRDVAAYQVSAAAAPQTGAGYPFPAIAYTLIVDGGGIVYLCHDLETRVWHSAAVIAGISRNKSHVGICYTGDDQPNAAQLNGLRQAIQWVERRLGWKLAVEGHRDAPYDTTCPGPKWPAWRASVIS